MLPLHWLLLNSSRIHVHKMSALIFPCVVSSCENFRCQRLMCKSIIVRNPQINFQNEKKKKKPNPNQQCQEIILWALTLLQGQSWLSWSPASWLCWKLLPRGESTQAQLTLAGSGCCAQGGRELMTLWTTKGSSTVVVFQTGSPSRAVQLMLAFLSLSVPLRVYLTCLS